MKRNRVLKGKIIERFGSQWRFAQALGVHEGVVSKIVNRRRSLGKTAKQRWAKILKCDPEMFDRQ